MDINNFLDNYNNVSEKLGYKTNVIFTYREIQILYEFLSKVIYSNGQGFTLYHHILFMENYYAIYHAMIELEKKIRAEFGIDNEKMAEYKNKKDKLVYKFMDRDEQGNPVYQENKPVINDNIVEFNDAITKLDEEYASYIKNFEARQLEYQSFINVNTVNFEKFLMFNDLELYNSLFTPIIFNIYFSKYNFSK